MMRKLLSVLATFVALTSLGMAQTVFINEIHYDNVGADVNEGVEIAGPASTDLSGWALYGYNGSNGAVYSTTTLTGVIPDQDNGYGTLWFPIAGLQNGSPDGVVLADSGNFVVQFLSYEGSFTATGGIANGFTSTDIGVAETGTTPTTYSLQLTGSGLTYGQFTWSGPMGATNGLVNTGQSFVAGAAPIVADAYTSDTGDIIVTFGTNVDQTTAETPGFYQLSDGVNTSGFISAVRDSTNHKVVYLLTPTDLTEFDDITSDILTVNGVQAEGGSTPTNNATSPHFYAGILSISQIQQNTLYPSTNITIEGIICANDAYNQVWIADNSGPWNGVMVYGTTAPSLVNVGDSVALVGTTEEYYNLTEFDSSNVLKIFSTGNTPYAPVTVTCADLDSTAAPDSAPAEQYEGVLVTLNNATTTSNPDSNYEFLVTDNGGTNLTKIDDDAWYHYGGNTFSSGVAYTSITGVVTYTYSQYKVLPRSMSDMVLAPPPAEVPDWILIR